MTIIYSMLCVAFVVIFVLYFVCLSKSNTAMQDVCIIAMFLLASSTLILIFK